MSSLFEHSKSSRKSSRKSIFTRENVSTTHISLKLFDRNFGTIFVRNGRIFGKIFKTIRRIFGGIFVMFSGVHIAFTILIGTSLRTYSVCTKA